MKPEISLPHSQQTATGPYPEPDESSLHTPTLFYFPKIYFNIIFPSMIVLPSSLFPSGLPTKILYTILILQTLPRVLRSHPISSFL